MGYPLPFRYLPFVVSSLPAFEHMTILKTRIDFPRRGAKAPPLPPHLWRAFPFPPVTNIELRRDWQMLRGSGNMDYVDELFKDL